LAADIVVRRASEIALNDMRMQTKGTHAGIAIQNAKGDVVAFSLNVRRWIESRPSAATQPISTLRATDKGATARIVLPPGRYRLLLISDGAATVSVAATGDLIQSLKPKAPRPVDVRVREITNAQGLVGMGTERMDLRRAALYVFGIHTETQAHQASGENFCLASVGATVCHPTNDIGGAVVRTTVAARPNDGWIRRSIYSPLGAPDSRGVYDAIFRDASVDLPARRDAIVVII
jgi:hypothetical protein